jgi:hypothetical protein
VGPGEEADLPEHLLVLARAQPPQRRQRQVRQRQPGPGVERADLRQQAFGLGDEHGVAMRAQLVELAPAPRVVVGKQQGVEAGDGTERLAHGGAERLGHLGDERHSVIEVRRGGAADARQHVLGREAHRGERSERRRGDRSDVLRRLVDLGQRHARERPVPRRVDAPDTLLQRRVRRQQAARPEAQRVGEEQVAHLLGRPRAHARALGVAADPLDRFREARAAGELHRGGVGQELALARDGGLDQAPEHQADPAQEAEPECDRQERGVTPAAFALEQNPSRARHQQEAVQQADQP